MYVSSVCSNRRYAATLLAFAFLTFYSLAPTAHAQSVAVAEVDGHVTDPSGQAIVGATVKMTETERNQVRITNTDSTPDVCEQKIPADLNRVLTLEFPGFRAARLTDQSEDAARFSKRSGGDGCITVAMGDFDGDGQKDIALLLTNGHSNGVRLVVALRRSTSWAVYRLPTWCAAVSACYVQMVKPGLFRRSEAQDTPVSSPDERDQIDSRTESVMSGTVESTGIVYVYTKGKWQYVWVSD